VANEQIVDQAEGPVPRRRRGWRWVWIGLAVVAVVLAWDGFRAWQIESSLGLAEADITQLRADIDASEWSALQTDADRLVKDSHGAASATHDPFWVLTTHVPWLGTNPREVSVVARALETVARHGVDPLVGSHSLAVVEAHDAGLATLMGALHSDTATISSAVAAVEQANLNVQSLHTGDLLPFVRHRVVAAQDKLARANEQIHNVGRLAIAAPALLGEDQPRTVLLLFQTPAEQRGTGGLVGAWGELHTDKGAVSLVDFGANDGLPPLPSLPAGVNPEIATDYGADIQLPQNFNLSASFPDAAQMFAASWTAGPGKGVRPDAVLSIDPVALGDLLSVIGSVQAGGQELTSDTAADVLLRKEYYTYTSVDQAPRVAFLGEVTKAVFDRVTSKGYSVAALGRKLASIAGEGRLVVWSADPTDQEQWQGLGLAGALGTPVPGSVRVALNSLDGSKLGAYLKMAAAVADCKAPGPLITLTFTSLAPAYIPAYAGSHLAGLDVTTMRLSYSLYVSTAWGVESVTVAGQPVHFSADTEGGWRLIRGAVDVARASTAVVEVQLMGGHGASQLTALSVQPQAIPVTTGITPTSPAGSGRCSG